MYYLCMALESQCDRDSKEPQMVTNQDYFFSKTLDTVNLNKLDQKRLTNIFSKFNVPSTLNQD